MKKHIFLEHLSSAINLEEHATTIYLEHIRALSNNLQISSEDKETITANLNKLISYNNNHKKICEEMHKEVTAENCDDY
jgi:hypothetical protein